MISRLVAILGLALLALGAAACQSGGPSGQPYTAADDRTGSGSGGGGGGGGGGGY
jgi:hypothetical protein